MLSNKLICKICGNEYDSCPTCQSDKVLFRWRNVACCVEHADIYLSLITFTRSDKTENDFKEAKESISRHDLSKITFSVENRQLVDKICNVGIKEENSNLISQTKKINKRKSAKQYERR